jgi:hypothetical protein
LRKRTVDRGRDRAGNARFTHTSTRSSIPYPTTAAQEGGGRPAPPRRDRGWSRPPPPPPSTKRGRQVAAPPSPGGATAPPNLGGTGRKATPPPHKGQTAASADWDEEAKPPPLPSGPKGPSRRCRPTWRGNTAVVAGTQLARTSHRVPSSTPAASPGRQISPSLRELTRAEGRRGLAAAFLGARTVGWRRLLWRRRGGGEGRLEVGRI